MHDWNVVVTTKPDGFRLGRQLLRRIGPVEITDYYNVLVMQADDPDRFLEELSRLASDEPDLLDAVSRVVPLRECFEFQSLDEFRDRAAEIVRQWLPALAGRSFHVRVHRRGERDFISGQAEEQHLDRLLLDALDEAGTRGTISFRNPDAIVDIETVGPRAGMSLWTREQRRRFRFLRID